MALFLVIKHHNTLEIPTSNKKMTKRILDMPSVVGYKDIKNNVSVLLCMGKISSWFCSLIWVIMEEPYCQRFHVGYSLMTKS